MEKHHKLRRPQGSSIHGCNICGKEGHQAAVCPNGTSNNWPEKFGPLWTVDLDAVAAKQREPDYKAIAERARAFVAERLAAEEAGESAAEGAGGRENADGEGAGTGTGTGTGTGRGRGRRVPPYPIGASITTRWAGRTTTTASPDRPSGPRPRREADAL